MNNDIATFRVKCHKSAILSWLGAAGACSAMALLPALIVSQRTATTNLRPGLYVAIFFWCTTFLSLGTVFAYNALCRRSIMVSDGTIAICRHLLWLKWCRAYPKVDRVYYVRIWRQTGRGQYEEEAIYLRAGGRKRWLTTGIESRDLDGLYHWLREHTALKCIDARNRAPISA